MGKRIEFASNGHTCQGYVAAPESGKGAAVVVIQEWWGLVPHIEDLVERFAKAGFVAIAPDLFHGKTTTSPDEAGRLLMELDADRAQREIAGAGAYLLGRPDCSSKTYGVVGFCMGGALAQYDATHDPAHVGAAMSFYGGFRKLDMKWSDLEAPLYLIYAGNDKSVPPDQGRELEKNLKGMGKNVTLKVYPDAGHAFFNDARPQVYNDSASKDSWKIAVDFFRAHVK